MWAEVALVGVNHSGVFGWTSGLGVIALLGPEVIPGDGLRANTWNFYSRNIFGGDV
jgi:hypothetical protein